MEKERAEQKRKKRGKTTNGKGGQARRAVDADENIQRNSFPFPPPALQKSGSVMGMLGEELFSVKPIYLCLTLRLIDLGFILERKGFMLALGWHHTGCPGQFKWEGSFNHVSLP